ncbi:response regulator transcription factor [Palleronia caenipelagi]|uniref:Response regulator n=1 Tax=Palleronia caenipelagi TaxID=2489174 RepID=A0A547PMP5_9RHOB|nr:response regulator [Palleronia caenipelagi]TRD15396.1 response regulator [Palleronia caenipelagi]
MGSAKKILLVEDEDNIALALEFLIRRQGFDLDRVATGTDAVTALERDCPDLVLLDVMLPGVSGYEILQMIRGTDRLRHIKVLMMSASGGEIARRKGLAMGADAYLTKPFETSHLTAQICDLLGTPAHG